MTNSHILKLYECLRDEIDELSFTLPVHAVYNPLRYAWDGFAKYLRLVCPHPRVAFLGMNPGPYGMTQTGIPFGEVEAVKNFLGITEIDITPPEYIHPSYPVRGLECPRSEVSGRRLWGLFRERFGNRDAFFHEHVVLNYCPLMFLSEGSNGRAKNLTPDKLAKSDREKLFALCDACLRKVIESLRPKVVIGVGNFAATRASESLRGLDVRTVRVLHPSPASPASNNGWAIKARQQLFEQEVWS